ncbi:hypothetical protein EDB86DRAFT_1455172 [Lactarius hatsudake]|nr:hypothetical protein EDB86DRAFT_1455172 [Lactarius hatsudake]
MKEPDVLTVHLSAPRIQGMTALTDAPRMHIVQFFLALLRERIPDTLSPCRCSRALHHPAIAPPQAPQRSKTSSTLPACKSRSAWSRSQESMTMAPEPALSSLASSRMASNFRSNSLCKRYPLLGAGRRRRRRRCSSAKRRGRRFCLCSTISHLCTRTSTLPFLSARLPPVREFLLCYTHQCTTTFSGCPGRTSQPLLDVGKSNIVNKLKRAKVSFF